MGAMPKPRRRARKKGWHDSVLDLIGNTPMVRLRGVVPEGGAMVLAKLEYTNPSGSLKDRIALNIVREAERRKVLKRGMAVVEPTSGNTGAGLALVCALRGYPMIAAMPEAMSRERAALIGALGASLRLTRCNGGEPGTFTKDDIDRLITEAEAISRRPGVFMPNQFTNPDNPAAHAGTAREIWRQTGGRIHAFVMGVGTSGTLMGVGRWLKKKNRRVRVVAVEPDGSAVLSGCEPGPHKLQGIGEGFVPEIYAQDVVDEVVRIGDSEAKRVACRLAREQGILAGYSGGANVSAAGQVAAALGRRKVVVTLVPDTGLKYLSTDLYLPEPEQCRRCESRERCEENARVLSEVTAASASM